MNLKKVRKSNLSEEMQMNGGKGKEMGRKKNQENDKKEMRRIK